ncbi:MAG: glycosyltransferase [Nocardioidaceae bacterium]
MPVSPRVVAVVVTWNRRELLTEALDALAAQTYPLAGTVVVDNASSDGTAAGVRAAYPSVDLVPLTRNTGGAGGFAVGIERALETHHPDLLWLLDDDTVPDPTALEALVAARGRYRGTPPSVLASRVVWTDGRDHPMNTPRRKPMVSAPERADAGAVGALPVRSASFVSIAVDAMAVRERGLPVADYFLWNDDFEFTTRLLRDRVGLHVPASRVVHKTRTFGSTDADPGDRFFFEVRNKVWLFTRSPGLAPLERLLYAGSTARRWARTFASSSDRRTLLRGLGRGVVAGLRHGPRPTRDVVASALPGHVEAAGDDDD